jgi:hypothetical protein
LTFYESIKINGRAKSSPENDPGPLKSCPENQTLFKKILDV